MKITNRQAGGLSALRSFAGLSRPDKMMLVKVVGGGMSGRMVKIHAEVNKRAAEYRFENAHYCPVQIDNKPMVLLALGDFERMNLYWHPLKGVWRRTKPVAPQSVTG